MPAQHELAIRDLHPARDLNFLQSSWLRSFRESRYIGPISPRAYWPAYQETICEVLERSLAKVMTTAEDPSDILGYVVYEQGALPIVHYIYVKHTVRRSGIATALLAAALPGATGFSYTFRTSKSQVFSKRYYMTWNPQLISDRRHEPEESQAST